MNTLLSRLRLATAPELELFEEVLEVKPSGERELRLAALHDEYLSLATAETFREALIAAIPLAAKDAGWTAPKPSATVKAAWIEEYLYRVMCFTHHSKSTSPSEKERAEAQERAEAAFYGKVEPEPPESLLEQSMVIAGGAAAVIAGGFAVGALLVSVGLPTLLIGGVLRGVVALLDSPDSNPDPKLLQATLILIHVRKRVEFTQVVDSESTKVVA